MLQCTKCYAPIEHDSPRADLCSVCCDRNHRRQHVQLIVIDWLGAMYDAHGEYPGNPDYFQPTEVRELADLICDKLERTM